MLVKGGVENTHRETYIAYKRAMMNMQKEKVEAREKAEQFFAEDAHDYEERIDGRGPFNPLLKMDYVLEGSIGVFLFLFSKVILPK